ncbi:AraC family transcriptional regulator [Sciscionella sediminilitoris]|uniref:AraC family transcriptional regulator n=1 Tax=Sciscionella sediminilitoris TaxID=1445613 RepID=UPI0006911EE5|nr:AraC family transcriptional regulator [Sciscionella sp. SE31]
MTVSAYPGEAAGPTTLLSKREICRTSSLEVIRENLGTVFYPARVDPAERHGGRPASLLAAACGLDLTVGLLWFGSDMLIDPGALGTYHVNVPVSGSVASECGGRRSMATVQRGAVFTPRDHTLLPRWSKDATQICVKIRKTAVEAELEALLGHPVAGDVDFELGFDLGTAQAQSWLGALRMALAELDRPGSLLETSPSYRRYLEKALIAGLLYAQPHRFHAELTAEQPPARPRTVKRAIELIESDPQATYSLASLARHAGVSARRLQVAFSETLHTTPMAYQRRVKLEHARAELLAGGHSTAEVAYRWGFSNPGRFAAYYRDVYGECPSDTLRRIT